MILLLPLFCLGCNLGCRHLYVQQESVDGHYLASYRVDTPDPKREDPPVGKMLLLSWDFPKSVFREGLTAWVTVRDWNNTQTIEKISIERKRDTAKIFFPDILTYQVQVRNERGEVVETWNHQFWTELIQIDETISSVSSHERQGSVIETP
jgi:hypothetical protein